MTLDPETLETIRTDTLEAIEHGQREGRREFVPVETDKLLALLDAVGERVSEVAVVTVVRDGEVSVCKVFEERKAAVACFMELSDDPDRDSDDEVRISVSAVEVVRALSEGRVGGQDE